MTKPLLVFIGHVLKTTTVNPAKGKPYLSVKIEGQAEIYNAKSYSTKLEARVYFGHEELSKSLQVGDLVSVSGNARADHFEWQSKHYGTLICDRANLVRIEPVHPQNASEPSVPAQSTMAQPLDKQQDEEIVPF